jgi:uracil-DNA glycosylase
VRYDWIWSCPYDDEGWKVWMEDQIGKVALQTVWEQKVKDCTRCELSKTRTQIVYGIGQTEQPDFLFIGEGPGADEDRLGEPFVGAAGKLFDKILAALKLEREDIYICNVVSCRPPGNRDPKHAELVACAPVWTSQIVAVRPRMIIALGKIAGNVLLGTRAEAVAKMRKKVHAWNKIPLQVTYHPAGMLRNENYKQPAWEDLLNAQGYVAQIKAKALDSGPLFGGE